MYYEVPLRHEILHCYGVVTWNSGFSLGNVEKLACANLADSEYGYKTVDLVGPARTGKHLL
jgi:hypothetical protein